MTDEKLIPIHVVARLGWNLLMASVQKIQLFNRIQFCNKRQYGRIKKKQKKTIVFIATFYAGFLHYKAKSIVIFFVRFILKKAFIVFTYFRIE